MVNCKKEEKAGCPKKPVKIKKNGSPDLRHATFNKRCQTGQGININTTANDAFSSPYQNTG